MFTTKTAPLLCYLIYLGVFESFELRFIFFLDLKIRGEGGVRMDMSVSAFIDPFVHVDPSHFSTFKHKDSF